MTDRTATTFLDYREARAQARRRLPRGVFEYIDRGTEAETAMSHNRARFDALRVVPRVLAGGAARDLSADYLGTHRELPFIMAPTAFSGMVRHRGDIALSRAARSLGLPFCVATEGLLSIDEIAAASPAEHWFQIYLWTGEENWRPLLARARDAGVEILVMTIDTPVYPKRTFNQHNGFGLPLRYGPRNIADVLSRPLWAADVLGRALVSGGLPRFAHHPRAAEAPITGRGVPPMTHQAGLNWDHVAKVRASWKGKLLLKGILHPDDARRAVSEGADGVIVSSHGMRNLDISVAPLDMLPALRKALGDKTTILADSGVQRGSDVFKLLHAGADAVLLGRAMLYGLASGGQAGVQAMVDILADELDCTMAMCGCRTLADIRHASVERDYIRK